MVGAVMSLCATQVGAQEAPQEPTGDRTVGVVLIGPVQGTENVREDYRARVHRALEQALSENGYASSVDGPVGRHLVTCGSPECNRAALEQVDARFAVVPAVWVRAGGRLELTLTLVGKSGRNANAGTVLNGDLSSTTEALVRLLLERRAREGATSVSAGVWILPEPEGVDGDPRRGRRESRALERPRLQHAWMAGPVALWAGAAATFISVGAVAGMRDEAESLNRGAVAGWFALGGAALVGGTAWWMIGSQRRSSGAREFAIHVSPSGFDMRGRF